MSGFPNPKHEEDAEAPRLQRTCDNCGDSMALLYCKADSAKLCFSCDRVVHSTNQLFSKHTRTQLCDACGDSPATILCCDENSALCQNCDWERHDLSLSTVHQRRPLEGFSGCPSVTQLLTIVDLTEKALLSTEGISETEKGLSDLLVWDGPSVFGLDHLIASTASSHNHQAMTVPPLHKKCKAACGRQKEEILRQLRELTKSAPDLIYGDVNAEQHVQSGNLCSGFERDIDTDIFPSCEAPVFWWHRENSDPVNQVVPCDMSLGAYGEQVPTKDRISTVSDGTHANGNNEGKPSNSFNAETLTTPKTTPYELTSQERDSALLRYKEKKKTRRYDKHIRYESRKVRAESRIRIKGRFAKDGTQ